MKHIRIRAVSPETVHHGKSVQILDDQGRELSHLCRRVEITLDANAVTTAKLEVYASVEVEALVEQVTVLERSCLHCEGRSIVETTPFGVPVKTFARGGNNGSPE